MQRPQPYVPYSPPGPAIAPPPPRAAPTCAIPIGLHHPPRSSASYLAAKTGVADSPPRAAPPVARGPRLRLRTQEPAPLLPQHSIAPLTTGSPHSLRSHSNSRTRLGPPSPLQVASTPPRIPPPPGLHLHVGSALLRPVATIPPTVDNFTCPGPPPVDDRKPPQLRRPPAATTRPHRTAYASTTRQCSRLHSPPAIPLHPRSHLRQLHPDHRTYSHPLHTGWSPLADKHANPPSTAPVQRPHPRQSPPTETPHATLNTSLRRHPPPLSLYLLL